MTAHDEAVRDFQEMRRQWEAEWQRRTSSNGHGGPDAARPQEEDVAALPVATYASLAARQRLARRFLIEGILPAEEGLLLSAKERSFKSFLTMEFCKAVAAGRPLFGAFAVAEPARVLLVDLENTRSRLCERMDAALAHDGLSAQIFEDRLIVFDRDEMPRWVYDAEGLARLEATIVRDRPALVVVDNLRKATPPGKDENQTKDMVPVASALAQMCETHHTALVLVHHDRRDGSGYSGSGSLSGSMANDVHVKYDRKTRIASVYCESMRNAEPFAPFAVAMGRGGALVLCDVPEDPDDPEETDRGELVLTTLKSGAKAIKEIVDCMGLNRDELRPILGRLQAIGLVLKVGERIAGRGKPAALYGLRAEPG